MKMEKQDLLQQIKSAALSGELSRQELLDAYDSTKPKISETKTGQRTSFSESIQYLGSGIVFIGIALLVGNNWQTLSFAVKILATLGAALVAFIIAAMLLRQEKTRRLGYAFSLISILVMPVGIYAVFDALHLSLRNNGQAILFELILLAIYIPARYAVKLRLYIVPITFFSTALFFSLAGSVIGPVAGTSTVNFAAYRFLISGLSYILLGYYYTTKTDRIFAALFHVFGIFFVLTAALVLSGFSIEKTAIQAFWEFFFPILGLASMYFGVFVQQKKVLILSALFLMAYVLKISSEYFSGSLGWPLAVVIAGLVMIAVGYFSVYLNRKYIKT